MIDGVIPSGDPIEVIEERIRKAEEESAKLTEWPDVANYVEGCDDPCEELDEIIAMIKREMEEEKAKAK